jgi:hypothetical protein
LEKAGTLKFYFGKTGTTADSLEISTGALTITGAAWHLEATLQRVSNTVLNISYIITYGTTGRTITAGVTATGNYTIGSGTALALATQIYYWSVSGTSTAGLTANDVTANNGFAEYITPK